MKIKSIESVAVTSRRNKLIIEATGLAGLAGYAHPRLVPGDQDPMDSIYELAFEVDRAPMVGISRPEVKVSTEIADSAQISAIVVRGQEDLIEVRRDHFILDLSPPDYAGVVIPPDRRTVPHGPDPEPDWHSPVDTGPYEAREGFTREQNTPAEPIGKPRP